MSSNSAGEPMELRPPLRSSASAFAKFTDVGLISLSRSSRVSAIAFICISRAGSCTLCHSVLFFSFCPAQSACAASSRASTGAVVSVAHSRPARAELMPVQRCTMFFFRGARTDWQV